MEKRFYLGLGILLLFLVLGLAITWGMEQVSQPVVRLLEEAAQEMLSGSSEQGIRLVRQARQLWDRSWTAAALAADHSPMDEIDGLFAQMDFYAQAKSRTELGACCLRLAELVEAVAEAHALTWWNLL